MNINNSIDMLYTYWSAVITADLLKMTSVTSRLHRSPNDRIQYVMKEVEGSPVNFIPHSRIRNESLNLFEVDIEIESSCDEIVPNQPYRYKVFTRKGRRLVSDENVIFAEDGKILFTGNCMDVEIVEKLKMANNDVMAGFAIRSRVDDKIKAIKLNRSRIITENDMHHGATFDEDGFYNISFSPVELGIYSDDGFTVPISIFMENSIIKSEIMIRGIGDPLFVNNGYPVIEKNSVKLPNHLYDKHVPWSLTVFLVDGTSEQFLLPENKIYIFSQNVSKAIITDALDNDWEMHSNV